MTVGISSLQSFYSYSLADASPHYPRKNPRYAFRFMGRERSPSGSSTTARTVCRSKRNTFEGIYHGVYGIPMNTGDFEKAPFAQFLGSRIAAGFTNAGYRTIHIACPQGATTEAITQAVRSSGSHGGFVVSMNEWYTIAAAPLRHLASSSTISTCWYSERAANYYRNAISPAARFRGLMRWIR